MESAPFLLALNRIEYLYCRKLKMKTGSGIPERTLSHVKEYSAGGKLRNAVYPSEADFLQLPFEFHDR